MACDWRGKVQELLCVTSEGLTLESLVQKLTGDALDLLAVHTSKPIGVLLLRWGIIKVDDPQTMRMVIARLVGAMVGELLRFTAGPGTPQVVFRPDLEVDDGESGEEVEGPVPGRFP